MAKRKRGKRQGPPLHEDAAAVLRERGPMHYQDLAEVLIAQGRRTRGKTFPQTLSAMLSRRDEFARVAPSVYELAIPTKEDS